MTSPAPTPVPDPCPLAAWGCRAGLRQPGWRVMSSHVTSGGLVEYCRCACAALVVLDEHGVAAFAAAPHPA